MLDELDPDDETKGKEWLNEGYLSLSEVAKIFGTKTETTSQATIQLPPDLIELDGVFVSSRKMSKLDREDTVEVAGIPCYYYKQGKTIGLYPQPGGEYQVIFEYYKYPAKLVNDEDTPVIPEAFHGAIVDYARAKQIKNDDPDTEDLEIASVYLGHFEKAKHELKIQSATDDNAPRTIKDVYWGVQ